MNRYDEALTLFKGQEDICREILDAETLAGNLINQASLYVRESNFDKALKLAEEAYEIAKRSGYNNLARHIGPILQSIQAQRFSPGSNTSNAESIPGTENSSNFKLARTMPDRAPWVSPLLPG